MSPCSTLSYTPGISGWSDTLPVEFLYVHVHVLRVRLDVKNFSIYIVHVHVHVHVHVSHCVSLRHIIIFKAVLNKVRQENVAALGGI